MIRMDVKNIRGDIVSQVELPPEIYGVDVKPEVLHQVITMQLASKRQGDASAKDRGEVSGSTRKLYRQKGTGRARRGSIKSPLLRGGGVTFGPKPRSYAYSVPKKVRKLAVKMALSSKVAGQRMTILDKVELEDIKTRRFVEILTGLGLTGFLMVTPQKDDKVELSARNLPNVKVLRMEGLNAYDILKFDHIVLLEQALPAIQERLT